MGDIGRDGLRRVLAKRREARPVVDVDQDGAVGLRKCDIAPEHLEPEDRRRLERERLEPVLVHRGPLAGKAGLRAVPVEEATVGHAVELHHGTGHVLLQRHPGDAALGEPPHRVRHLVERGRDHVFGPLRVHVAPLDPDFLVIGAQGLELARGRERRGAGMNERAWERHRAVAQPLHQAVAVTAQGAGRAIHHDRTVELERHQLLGRERALAHVEVQRRGGKAALLDLPLGGLDRLPTLGFEPRDRRIQDRRIIHAVLQR